MKYINEQVTLAVLLAFSLSVANAALADDDPPAVTYPTIPAAAATAKDFVPAGWKLEAQETGDLNGDGTEDIALVLLDQDPRNIVKNDDRSFDTNPRMLVIALADGHGGYRLALADHTLISRPDNPDQDDKFAGIKIVKRTLQVSLQNFMTAGGWTVDNYTYTFRLKQGAFDLIGYERVDTARNTGEIEMLSVNYATGRYSRGKGTIESDKTRVNWHRLASGKAPITLEQIGDGMAFEPAGVRE